MTRRSQSPTFNSLVALLLILLILLSHGLVMVVVMNGSQASQCTSGPQVTGKMHPFLQSCIVIAPDLFLYARAVMR